MKLWKIIILILIGVGIFAGCTATPAAPTATPLPPTETMVLATQTPVPTATPEPTETPTLEPTPSYPPEGLGPANFPTDVNPLTGLAVSDPQILNRRPVLIKIQNLPRKDRPQYGVSFADWVYEYYTEFGSTRFAALYYGQDAEQIMPIRSARFIDVNLIRMYKPIFIFGSAYEAVWMRLVNSEFANQLVLENSNSCPSICRFDPNGLNYLSANTKELQKYLSANAIDNSKQNLDGLFFRVQPPDFGKSASQVFARFSGAIYNRWDYDPGTGKYLRFSDAEDDVERKNEVYAPLTDAITGKQIAMDNLVILTVRHEEVDPRPETEVLDLSLLGTGKAYVARDGQIFEVNWQRLSENQVLTLVSPDGTLFPMKPGNTWVEVMSLNTKVEQLDNAWRFTFVSDW